MKAIVCFVLLVSTCFQLSAQHTRVLSKEYLLYSNAVDLVEKEKYVAAQKLFDEYIEQNSSNANVDLGDAYYYAAYASIQLYNEDAVYRMEQFLSLYPQSPKTSLAYFHLARFYYNNKELSKALDLFNKIGKESLPLSLQDEFLFKKAYCLLQEGNSKEAKSLFAQVQAGDNKYASPAKYYYAHVLYEEKSYTAALKGFSELKNDALFSSIVPFYIAQIYYLQGKYAELEKMVPDLLEKAPPKRRLEIARMTGQILYDKEMYTEALPYLKQSIEENELAGDKDFYVLAFTYYKTASYPQSVELINKMNLEDDTLSQYAFFLLGKSQLKMNKKQEARSAFLSASEMSQSLEMKEESLYLYAMISFELPNNPYNESIKSFQKYLKLYPQGKYAENASEILASLFFSVKNYKDALELIETIKTRTPAIKKAHQRICYNRAVELYNEQKTEEAIPLFQKTITLDQDDELSATSYYWIAEIAFSAGKYQESVESLKLFFNSLGAKSSSCLDGAFYTMGCSYLKLKDYAKASVYFERYLTNKKSGAEEAMHTDAYNRFGDCLFMQKKYAEAYKQYEAHIQRKGKDSDYALYQQALSRGAMANYPAKIELLKKVIVTFPESVYRPMAYMEIANTYLLQDDNKEAYRYFSLLSAEYPKSMYNKSAMLKKGMILYTSSRDEEALEVLNQLVENYQGSKEAKDALMTIKNIYISQNRVEDYFSYIKNIPQANISSSEKDSITYLAAENRYLEGDCVGAVKGLTNYLELFPTGVYELYANFYIADCLRKEGKAQQAIPYLESIVKRPKSIFYERAVVNLATSYFMIGNYEKARYYYTILSQNFESRANLTLSLIGEMRCNFLLQEYPKAIDMAKKVLELEQLSSEVVDESNFTIARSYFILNDTTNARIAYKKLESSKNREYAGEASYRNAERLFMLGKINEAETAIMNITSDPKADYWLAKSFILWAKIYKQRNNLIQAKQTLQSIIENFDGIDLVEEAKREYEEIVKLESETKEKKRQGKEELKRKQQDEIDLNQKVESE